MTLTSTTKIKHDWFLSEANDNISSNDNGIFEYNVPMTSGTGVQQFDTIAYNDFTIPAASSVDIRLSNFPKDIQGDTAYIDFVGGSVKSIGFQNNSNNNINVSMTLGGFNNASTITLYPSGNDIYSNLDGWIPTLSDDTINVAADTESNFSMVIIGNKNPA